MKTDILNSDTLYTAKMHPFLENEQQDDVVEQIVKVISN